MQFSQLQVIR